VDLNPVLRLTRTLLHHQSLPSFGCCRGRRCRLGVHAGNIARCFTFKHMITSNIIKARRALREAKQEQAEKLPALENAIYELRMKVEIAGQAYGDALDEAGLCRWCEQSKDICQGHVLMAAQRAL
jgi:hypothetical protein